MPGTCLQHRADGVGRAAVRVADDELDTGEAAVTQVPEELGPEGFGLAVADRAAQHAESRSSSTKGGNPAVYVSRHIS